MKKVRGREKVILRRAMVKTDYTKHYKIGERTPRPFSTMLIASKDRRARRNTKIEGVEKVDHGAIKKIILFSSFCCGCGWHMAWRCVVWRGMDEQKTNI